MSPQPEVRPMSEAGRLANVFFEPRRAFADIAERPRPWVPLILLIVTSVAFVALFSQRVGWERFMRQQFETNAQLQKVPVEQRERALEMQTKVASIMGYVGPVVSIPVMALIIAGAVLGMAKMLGASLSFKQMFGVVSYGMLPGVLNSLAGIAVMFLKSPDDFNLQNPTAFNVAAYLDPQSTAKWLQSIGSSLDLFVIWQVLLIAVGITAASRRFPFGKALAAVVAPWLLWIVLKAGVAAIRG